MCNLTDFKYKVFYDTNLLANRTVSPKTNFQTQPESVDLKNTSALHNASMLNNQHLSELKSDVSLSKKNSCFKPMLDSLQKQKVNMRMTKSVLPSDSVLKDGFNSEKVVKLNADITSNNQTGRPIIAKGVFDQISKDEEKRTRNFICLSLSESDISGAITPGLERTNRKTIEPSNRFSFSGQKSENKISPILFKKKKKE